MATSVPGAPEPVSPPPAAPKAMKQVDIAGRLGGYELKGKLGQGGMGAVYLARQLSLDRDVAVKVLSPKWAGDPQFVARFTREAYAAAQLVHHNVVQIHDIGAENNTHFYSMEFVEGQTLSDLVKQAGKLEPEVAVGYILQAARGLKFAHDHGMIHRDVKPDNLMLNDLGLVKVADLGLVKTPGLSESTPSATGGRGSSEISQMASSTTTQASVAMGTPAYMPPEQAIDAAKVDARADIYSLGCTLYHLLVGSPPFPGKTADEVITRHARDPITPPDVVNKRIPKQLSAIVQKMVAKKPEQRHPNLNEVIRELEDFLGVSSAGPFSPREEHVEAIEMQVKIFNSSNMAGLRGKLVLGFFLLCAMLVVFSALNGSWLWAGGFVGLMVMTPVFYQTLVGLTQRTFIFRKVRQLLFGSKISDWLMWIAGIGLAIAMLYLFNLLWVWLGFLIAAGALAFAFHFAVDAMVTKQRKKSIEMTDDLLKSLRLRGLEEDAIRQFVSKYAGDRWEEFYEALFGYEDKMIARKRWGIGTGGKLRPKFGAWRDAIIVWIDNKQKWRQEEKDRKHLQAIEVKSMEAKGVSMIEARRKAKHIAEAMVDKAAQIKEEAVSRASKTLAPSAAGAQTQVIVSKPLFDEEEMEKAGSSFEYKRKGYVGRRFGGPFGLILSGQVRFLAGAVLIVACLIWASQNKALPGQQGGIVLKENITEAINRDMAGGTISGEGLAANTLNADGSINYQPLKLGFVPAGIAAKFFNTWNAGVAGLILVISAMFGGMRMAFVALIASAVAFAGHLAPVPQIANFTPQTLTMAAGTAIAVFGFFFLRE